MKTISGDLFLNRLGIAALSLAALGACAQQQVTEAPPTAALAPMTQPVGPDLGSVAVWMKNGESEYTVEIAEKTDDIMTFSHSNGCVFTRPGRGFSPPIKFSNCGGDTDVVQTPTLSSGTPWPLTVGNKWTYDYTGSNTKGSKWKGSRTCEVTGEAHVTPPIGAYDTFKVRCEDPWRIRTYYMAPELGRAVVIHRHHKRRNKTSIHELVRVENKQT